MGEKGFAIRCPHCGQWNVQKELSPKNVALDSKQELKQILKNLQIASLLGDPDGFSHPKLFRCKSPRWFCPDSFEGFVCRSKDDALSFFEVAESSSLKRSFELYKEDCQNRWKGDYYGIIFCSQPIPRLRAIELGQLMERELLRRLIVGVGYEINAPVTFYALNIFEIELGKPEKYWMPIEGYSHEERWVPPRYNSLCHTCRSLVMGQLVTEFENQKYSVHNCPIKFGKNGRCAGRDAACMQEQRDWNQCPAFIKQRKSKCPCYKSDLKAIQEVEEKWRRGESIRYGIRHRCYLGFMEVALPIVVHDHLIGVTMTGQVFFDQQKITDIEDFIMGRCAWMPVDRPWDLLLKYKDRLEQAKKDLVNNERKTKQISQARFFINQSEFEERITTLNDNIKRIEDTAKSQYHDCRGKSESAFRNEIISFIRTYETEPTFFDDRVCHVLERMWQFWAFEGAYFARYSLATKEISVIAFSTKYGDVKSFGLPGKKLGRVEMEHLDIHPSKYVYREGCSFSGENRLIKEFIPLLEDAKQDVDLHLPIGKTYYIVFISFFEEVYAFVLTVRDEKAASSLERLDPAAVSQLCQDEILETCVQVAYEFRENRTFAEKHAELNFTQKLGNLVNPSHNNEIRLYSSIGKLQVALNDIPQEKKKETIIKDLTDVLDNIHRTYGSMHAVNILAKYMKMKVSGKLIDVCDRLKIESLNFCDLIEDLRNDRTLKARAEKWVKCLAIDMPTGVTSVTIDRWVLYECLYCIIDNAIIHGSQGKLKEQVEVTVKTMVDSTGPNPMLLVRIVDTGSGIEDRTSEKLNRYLSSSSIHEWPQEVGYGLLMAKCAVEVHKGNISFESQLNKGTTFEVRITT